MWFVIFYPMVVLIMDMFVVIFEVVLCIQWIFFVVVCLACVVGKSMSLSHGLYQLIQIYFIVSAAKYQITTQTCHQLRNNRKSKNVSNGLKRNIPHMKPENSVWLLKRKKKNHWWNMGISLRDHSENWLVRSLCQQQICSSIYSQSLAVESNRDYGTYECRWHVTIEERL